MQKQKKEGLISRTKKRFSYWSDMERLKSNWRYIVAVIKKFMVPQPAKNPESFEAAKVRLNLTEEQLASRQQALFQLSILMTILSLLLFIYALYLLVNGGFLGSLLTFSITSLALVMAFRYHFWYFQIKEKKLGCSLREWFKYGLLGAKR